MRGSTRGLAAGGGIGVGGRIGWFREGPQSGRLLLLAPHVVVKYLGARIKDTERWIWGEGTAKRHGKPKEKLDPLTLPIGFTPKRVQTL